MKKVIMFILILAMSTSVCSFATDYSSVPTDELIQMKNEIESEILSRIDSGLDNLYSGLYIGGVDIEPGQYTFTVTKSDSGNKIYVFIFENKESYEDRTALFTMYIDVGETNHLNITEGMYIEIGYGSGFIVPEN